MPEGWRSTSKRWIAQFRVGIHAKFPLRLIGIGETGYKLATTGGCARHRIVLLRLDACSFEHLRHPIHLRNH